MRSIGYLFIMILVASVSACHAGMEPPVGEAFLQFHENGGGVMDDGSMVDPGGDDDPAVSVDGQKAPSAVTDGPVAVPAASPAALITPPADTSAATTCTEDTDCGAGYVCKNGTCRYSVIYDAHITQCDVTTPIILYERGGDDSRTVRVTGIEGYQDQWREDVQYQGGDEAMEIIQNGDGASFELDQMQLVVSYYDSALSPHYTQWHVGDEPFAVTYENNESPPINLGVENGNGVYEWKVDDEIRCPSCFQMPLIAALPLPNGKASVPLTITDTVSGDSTEVLLFVVPNGQIDTGIVVDDPDDEDSDGDGTGDASDPEPARQD